MEALPSRNAKLEIKHPFISNNNCSVVLENKNLFVCQTHSKVANRILFGIGMLLIYGSIFVIGWELPQGRLHSTTLLAGSGVFCIGILFQWRCLHRKKEMGSFELSISLHNFQKVGTHIAFPFDQINRVRIARDWTALRRTDRFFTASFWLFIHFKSGAQFRIATGDRTEITRLLRWLKEAGVPTVDWV